MSRRHVLRLRYVLVLFAVLPVLLFSFLPIAAMSPAFDGPALTVTWDSQA